jgi:hypothetical protein
MSVSPVETVSAEPTEDAAQQRPDEIKTFLAAISTVLRETVSAFETTVSRITEITVTRPGRADRDLVVALQDFDRLQQEFATLSEIIARLSAKPEEGSSGGDAGKELIAGISIADLKDRLAHHIRVLTTNEPSPEALEEVVF